MKYLSVMVVFTVMFLMISPVFAEDVSVGTYVLNLGKFDTITGIFTADFYLSFICENECSPDNFEVLNGKIDKIEKIIDTPNEKFYRIRAELSSRVNMEKFPFDSQKMLIIIEDKKNTIDKIRYLPASESSGIEDSIAFTGWNIDGWEASVNEHTYIIYNETYSQYVFTIKISKIPLSSFLKTFLPVIFIIIIVMFSFVIDPDKITTRLTMISSGLIAAVMFHVSIASQIPSVGYLTFADKFMILAYIILLMSFIINITILEFYERKHKKMAMRIHRATEFSMFILVPVLFAILFIFFV
ncbi:MAG: hypothetical protein V1870_02290 [Candidatus Aenigmatarchaeota archaeon]